MQCGEGNTEGRGKEEEAWWCRGWMNGKKEKEKDENKENNKRKERRIPDQRSKGSKKGKEAILNQ